MLDLIFLSAAQLATLIRQRAVSAEEVMLAHLARIDDVNPRLNAIVQSSPAQALARARAADASAARGEWWGPLHGVPFTVKDWIETHDLVCTAGYASRQGYVPSADATVVARLRQAGAILLGKTNAVSGNEVYGLTNNPYNLAYSPAGSSSGEAAIIAAGGSPIGLGSDSGGSIRQPAHNCGIAGLKPTTGRVPLTGHYPRINVMNDPRTVIGPLARYVEDLALVLPIIQGIDWQDASVIPMPLAEWRLVRLAGLRVAFYTDYQEITPPAEVVHTVHKAVQALADAGMSVSERTPPLVEHTYQITRDYWNRPEPESWEVWDAGETTTLSSLEVEQHLFLWDRLRRALIAFMADYDVILTPAAQAPARPHDADPGHIAYTLTYSLVGYPAVVVRCGTAPDGMPIGVQVVARPWRDDVALAVAAWLEQACGGWQRTGLAV
ncbi:MAG TPA: amidase [Chloroflexi bacterium]|nr:amidase [Chloroflexota bacterium]HHW88467.1 amidase [Chloroflexota bacterium]